MNVVVNSMVHIGIDYLLVDHGVVYSIYLYPLAPPQLLLLVAGCSSSIDWADCRRSAFSVSGAQLLTVTRHDIHHPAPSKSQCQGK